jgi:hypothetical protein
MKQPHDDADGRAVESAIEAIGVVRCDGEDRRVVDEVGRDVPHDAELSAVDAAEHATRSRRDAHVFVDDAV